WSLRDQDVAVAGARNAPLQEEQVALAVDAHHLEVADGRARAPHAAREPLSLDHPGGVRARSDGARVARLRMAVGAGAPSEAVPLHAPLEAAALGASRDLHRVPGGELLDGELLADLELLALVQRDLTQHAWSALEPRRRGVPALGQRGALGGLG